MEATQPMITLNNVTRSFGDVIAVSKMDLHVKEGSLTGFLGPNGSGKSTSEKLIMGEIQPDSGSISVMNQDPWNNTIIKNKIGYVSEYEDLYPWMSAEKFVTSMARFFMPKEEAKRAAKETLKVVNLNTSKNIKSYSKGMKQRTKVAAAIVHNPDLLILDEPFGGLDPLGRREMKDLLIKINEQENKTILISSHILHEINEISTHMILIHRGQRIAEGRPTNIVDLIDRYPHLIELRGSEFELKKLSSLLLNENVIKSITVNSPENIHVVTEKASLFYPTITRIIAENEIIISEIESQTDNVEAIFEYLTR